jgi:hypothetical protein
MKRSVALVLALASLATLGTSQDAEANVRLTRRGDGRVVIFNDIGSGWRVSGRAPSDAFLVARKSAPTPFDETIHTCSRAHGIDPGLVKSVMLIESNFNPRALSRKGARGLMQLMPATARRFGVTNAFDPHENIRGGTAYLAWLLGTETSTSRSPATTPERAPWRDTAACLPTRKRRSTFAAACWSTAARVPRALSSKGASWGRASRPSWSPGASRRP